MSRADFVLVTRRLGRGLVMFAVASGLAACSRSAPPLQQQARIPPRPGIDPHTGTTASPRLIADGRPIPRGGGTYKIGVPYQVSGRWYFPKDEPDYDRRGVASWYGDDFHGRKTANGEVYDMGALSAAHPTLPMPSYVWVTNEQNGRTLLVRVNDRGPYARDRVIDLSRAAARALGSEGRGLANVRVRYAGPAPLDGDDRREQSYLRNQPWSSQAAPQLADQRRPAPLSITGHQRRYLSAGVFRSEDHARRRAEEIRRFVAADVRPVPGGSQTLYRVRTTAMDEVQALQLRQRLAEAGISDTVIVLE